MGLRDYQTEEFFAAREKLAVNDSVLLQLPTGGGKTPISSAITKSSFAKGFRIWFVVPRNELVDQASHHFQRWGVPHGFITARCEESRAYQVHIVSKDTLLRRLDRIKNWPDLLMFDEAHIAIDAQIKIIAKANEVRSIDGLRKIKVIGYTATPERLDGRGLWSGGGGPYDDIVMGPSIPWLTQAHFLSPLRYFAPPIKDLDKIHKRGTEYDEDELEALLVKNKVYGDVIGYYEKYGSVKHETICIPGQTICHTNENYSKGKPALIFCRSVKSAYETAKKFRDAGFNFYCIEGNLPASERKGLIDALTAGKIDGLTNCDICTYGLDVPRIEYGASLRPTLSRALYFQMVGRILRPFEDKITGYCKIDADFFDHANLVQEHFDPRYPGTPLFYLDDVDWNFTGDQKKHHEKMNPDDLHQCPLADYQWCGKQNCNGCEYKKSDAATTDPRKDGLVVIDTKLEERKAPPKLSDMQPEEKREIQDRICSATDIFISDIKTGKINHNAVLDLIKTAQEIGRQPMWVYHYLTGKKMEFDARDAGKEIEDYKRIHPVPVMVPLVYEIAKCAGYKNGWAYFKLKELRKGVKSVI
jgi:DNA repair protein RadD